MRRLKSWPWLALIGMVLIGGIHGIAPAHAASLEAIDVEVDGAISRFYREVRGAESFLSAAKGVLVFPNVVKAGFVLGLESGDGALRIGGKTEGYYNTTAASFGFQVGLQSKALFIVFMDEDAVGGFRSSFGWKLGVDGSVAVITVGAGGAIDTQNIKQPIVAFALTNGGLMVNLTLEGTKISPIHR